MWRDFRVLLRVNGLSPGEENYMKLKGAFTAFVIILFFTVIPEISLADTPDKVRYIRSNYTQGAYLYDAQGVLRYGIPTREDDRYQWIIEEKSSYKVIKNAATGNYITLEGHGDETVEGSWGEVISCSPFKEKKDTYLWEFELGEGQNLLSAGRAYQGFALHMENAGEGRPFAQRISGDQLAWGNMKWDFLKTEEMDFDSAVNHGFCIRSTETGAYLRTDNGALTNGIPDGPDDAYIWFIEEQADGSKAIRNKKTSRYITMAAYDSTSLTLGLADYAEGDDAFAWSLSISKSVPILSASKAYTGYGLYLEAASGRRVRCGEILSGDRLTGSEISKTGWSEGVLTGGMRWNVIPSSEVAEVSGDMVLAEGSYQLKNSWYDLYLIQDGKSAVYGNAKAEDGNAQWKLAYDAASGLTALQNAESGEYLYIREDTGSLEFSKEQIFYWKLLRHKNNEFPKAVIFQDSGRPDSYLHMESLNGRAEASNAVQPTWGTPHWEPIRVDEAETGSTGSGTDTGLQALEKIMASGNYIRLFSSAAEGEYLYENSSGAIAYRACDAGDARSHWKLTAGDAKGTYFLQNRETGDYVINKGNGTLRCLPEDQGAAGDGSLWGVMAGTREQTLLISSYYTDVPSYLRAYLNIQKLSGMAQSSLVSIEEATTQWNYEEAQVETVAASEKEAQAVPLRTFTDTRQYLIYENEQVLEGIFELQYTGSRVRIRETESDKYLYEDKSWELYTRAGTDYLKSGDTKLRLKKYLPVGAGESGLPASYRGADLPYVAYQAEDCITTGTVLEENRAYHEIPSEAAGRLAVRLDRTGQNIKITLVEPANALTIRYCIPDSPDGQGMDATLNLYIDGKKKQAVDLTSRYSWVYGSYPWTNQPADGQPHHFFDETGIRLDRTYPAGTVIKLQKDAANYAEYYIIDEVDAEEAAEAHLQPRNSLSITDYGAVAGDGQDDSKAVYDCMKAALEQGREIWIPAGVFDINSPTGGYDARDGQDKNRGILIIEDNVTFRGAGMWHSVLQGDYAAFFIKASNTALYDFSLRGTAEARRDAIDPSAIESDYNTYDMKNLTVQNIWIQHYKTGIWIHNMDGMKVAGCRIRDTFADGINLRKGTSNAVVEQCDIRNTGDDAIALWSSEKSDTNIKISFNTVGLQWLANSIAVYGGTDIEITDNVIYDTVVNGAGINISTNFDPQPFAGTVTVARNTLLRCGSEDGNNKQDNGAIWFNTVQGNDNRAKVLVLDNLILNSSRQGISFSNRGAISDVLLEGNAILGSGTYGIDVLKGARGNAAAKNNLIRDMMLEAVNNSAGDSFTLAVSIDSAEDMTKQEDGTANGPEEDNADVRDNAAVILIAAGAAVAVIGALAAGTVAWRKRRNHKV